MRLCSSRLPTPPTGASVAGSQTVSGSRVLKAAKRTRILMGMRPRMVKMTMTRMAKAIRRKRILIWIS